jgi:hypothetical protein
MNSPNHRAVQHLVVKFYIQITFLLFYIATFV